jgi:biopolymer transport protein ExbB
MTSIHLGGLEPLMRLLDRGGVTIWVIAALSVAALAVILWKIWHLARMGAWRCGQTPAALDLWSRGEVDAAERVVTGRPGARARLARAVMAAAN